jgi:hypothetical protein
MYVHSFVDPAGVSVARSPLLRPPCMGTCFGWREARDEQPFPSFPYLPGWEIPYDTGSHHRWLHATDTYALRRQLRKAYVRGQEARSNCFVVRAVRPYPLYALPAAIQLQGQFVVFWLVYFITLANGIALAYFVAAISPSLDAAAALLPTYVVTLLFFGGLLFPFSQMPPWWQWYSHISKCR